MKQYEAVIKVMEENGGFATLGLLNQKVLMIEDCKWKTKTPFASIRRIVQDERFFFKIRPGLWALKTCRDNLSSVMFPEIHEPETEHEEYSHSYYQGLLIEIGNFKKYQTFVPSQDKNKLFLGKKLSEIVTVFEMFEFSYDHIVRAARTIDVLWFNERNMPSNLFEIEHSTDMRNSLLKFVEIQDFCTNFYIVADDVRKREFQAKVSLEAFRPIRKRVEFRSYENVAELHSKASEYFSVESRLNL